MNLIEKIKDTTAYLKKQGIHNVDAAIILGTGLGQHFVENIDVSISLPYVDIPHFPESTVEFHHGSLVYGKIGDKNVLAFQGRFHYYEGYSMEEVTYPVRICQRLSAGYLVISNAAGCMNMDWEKGDLMVLDDHINLQIESPLRGKHFDELGSRFPDLSTPYDKSIKAELFKISEEMSAMLREGVYASMVGPQLETRAEYRMIKNMGADAVGMSTVPEVIVANQAELPCIAISVLTDMCDPDNLHPVDIDDFIATAGKAEPLLTKLCIELIKRY